MYIIGISKFRKIFGRFCKERTTVLKMFLLDADFCLVIFEISIWISILPMKNCYFNLSKTKTYDSVAYGYETICLTYTTLLYRYQLLFIIFFYTFVFYMFFFLIQSLCVHFLYGSLFIHSFFIWFVFYTVYFLYVCFYN